MTNRLTMMARTATIALLATGLAGCQVARIIKEDKPTPATYNQAHPISVSKGTVKLQIDARRGRLNLAQQDKVTRFAQDARAQATPHIVIRHPRGTSGSTSVANEISEILIREGINERAIDYVGYRGRGAVEISFKRYFASTPECGSWPEDITDDFSNRIYEDFGCSTQQNFAAQVANPRDLIQPRTSTPADATRRAKVFEAYREGEDTASADSENDDIEISDAAN